MIEFVTGEMVLLKGMSRGHFSPRAGQDADAALASSHSRCTRRLLLWRAPGPLHGGNFCIVAMPVESYEPAASVTVAELATMVLSETGGL
jgi:hypothetical protein